MNLYNNFEGLSIQKYFRTIIQGDIISYGLLLISVAVLRGLFLFLVRQTIIIVSRKIEYDLKNDIYKHIQTLPLEYYKQNSTGDLIARISDDVSKVRMYLGPALMYSLSVVVLFSTLIPYMFSVNPTLTLYTLSPLPILSISIYLVNNVINKKSELIQKQLSKMTSFVQEHFAGIQVIKAFAKEEESAENFELEAEDYKSKSISLGKTQAYFFPLILGLIGLSGLLTIYVGGKEVIAGNLEVGNIAEFIIYIGLLTWPVTSLGWMTSIIQRAAASQNRINQVFASENNILSDSKLKNEIKGDIEFKGVSFAYPDGGKTILNNINFKLEAGKTLAIFGSTGSGKSSLAQLIPRLYDITEGEVLIDGINIKKYDLQYLRSRVGYIPQDVFIFSESIKNNIAFTDHNLPMEDVLLASKRSDLHENVIQFEKQYDTKLGERGINLSGGQKQRLSIARSIAKDYQVFILDSVLSAVDTNTENTILHNLKSVMKNKSSIIISHRISSAKLADYIMVLGEGKVLEYGTENELLKQNGYYRSLYDKQRSKVRK